MSDNKQKDEIIDIEPQVISDEKPHAPKRAVGLRAGIIAGVAVLAALCGMDAVLPMNTGAEAVETAIKAARRFGYRVKGIPRDRAEIIVANGNFHGRTTTVISFSSESEYRDGFGPFTPGFFAVPRSEPPDDPKAARTNSRTRGHLMPNDSGSRNSIRFANQRERTREKSLVYQGIAQPLIHRVGEKSATPWTLSGCLAAR